MTIDSTEMDPVSNTPNQQTKAGSDLNIGNDPVKKPPRRWSRTHKLAVAAIAATLVAAGIGATAGWAKSDTADDGDITNHDGIVNVCGTEHQVGACSIDIAGAGDLTDEEIEEQLTRSDPAVGRPIPMILLHAEELGLKIRTMPGEDGQQIGTAANRGTVWVECKTDSGFNPDPHTGGGSIWYRVHWPSSELGTTFYNSEPGNPDDAWAYSGYLYPFGNPGVQIPVC